ALEMLEVLVGIARLRVILRIARDVDLEMIAGLLANERDEIARVAEFAGIDAARRQVAAQGDDVADVVRAVLLQHVTQRFAAAADARQVRRGSDALADHLEHRLERAFARRAARPERHRAERGLELRQLRACRAELRRAFRGLWREELEAERSILHPAFSASAATTMP